MADVVEAPDGPVADLIAITGQPLEEAARLLEAAGSVEAAVSLFFDSEAAADPAVEVAGAPQPPVEAVPTASSSAETSAAPRGKAAATTWQAAATGDTFRRRLLVGPDAVRQLQEDEHRAHHLVEWKSLAGAGAALFNTPREGVARSFPRRVKAHDVRSFHPVQVRARPEQ